MNEILKNTNVRDKIVFGMGTLVVGTFAPLVSLVALPIFALKALLNWGAHMYLYRQTLTNGTRAKFGRIEGQDYTRWDGKVVIQVKINPTAQERMHELMKKYFHGQNNRLFRKAGNQPPNCPFQTQEDLNWLKKEFVRREREDLLDDNLKMLRAFSKALIPILGVIWVLNTETQIGGASVMGCTVCMNKSAGDTHWGWERAIKFHERILTNKIGTSILSGGK